MSALKKIVVWILILESRLIVKKYKPYIVAVTGSVGKTSTKDAIFDVLKTHKGFVRKSEKSLNSEIGLPLTIIGVPNAWHSLSGWLSNISEGFKLLFNRTEYPDCLILEVGADHPGDIKSIAKWLKPDITVITRISKTPVHVEFFKSPEEVFQEKASLALATKKGGSLILFADDDNTMRLKDMMKDRDVAVITYGKSGDATMKGSNLKINYSDGAPTGFSFDIFIDGTPTTVVLSGIIGDTFIYPLLAAAAVGRVTKMDPKKIIDNLELFDAPRGRMNIIPGMNESTIIDDTYNSSPDAVRAALELMKSLDIKGKKIAVLGDMLELGKFASTEHREIGKVAASSVDILATVGQRSKLTAEEALRAGLRKGVNLFEFDSSLQAARELSGREASELPRIINKGDVVLVKGSQSMRMERVTKAIMLEAEKAADLLVRQEKEWLDKD